MSLPSSPRSLALLLLLGTLWGVLTPIAKQVGELGVPPLSYGMLVMLGAGLILLCARLARGRGIAVNAGSLRYYAVCGLLGSALPTVNMFHVLSVVPAGLMAIIIATSPMITYVLALAVGIERLVAVRAAGIALGLAGVLLILLPRASLPDAAMAGWALLAFVTPALYAANTVYASRHRPSRSDSLELAAGMLLGAGLLLSAAAAAAGQLARPLDYPLLANALIASHAVLTSLAFFIFFTLLETAGPVFVSQVGYIVTLVGVGVGVALLEESHSRYVWLSMLLIFAGLALVNRRQAA